MKLRVLNLDDSRSSTLMLGCLKADLRLMKDSESLLTNLVAYIELLDSDLINCSVNITMIENCTVDMCKTLCALPNPGFTAYAKELVTDIILALGDFGTGLLNKYFNEMGC